MSITSSIQLSSSTIYQDTSNSLSDDHQTASTYGAIINPLNGVSSHKSSNFTIPSISHYPVICLSCGGYLSSFATINTNTGSWRCPLCNSINDPFYTINNRKIYNHEIMHQQNDFIQLKSKDYEFQDEIFQKGHIVVTNVEKDILVFVLDTSLIVEAGAEFIHLLYDGICNLLEKQMISIIIFDRVINILRLADNIKECPLKMDTLSGTTDQSHSIHHFIQRGVYYTYASIVKLHFDSIQQTIQSLSAACSHRSTQSRTLTSNQSNMCRSYIDVIVQLVVRLRHSTLNQPTIRGLFFTSRSILMSGHQDIEQFRRLGQRSFREGCLMDVCYASVRPGNVDHLEELVRATGGFMMMSPESKCLDEGTKSTLMKLIGSGRSHGGIHDNPAGSTFQSNQRDVTIQIRTCGKLRVESVHGLIDEEDTTKQAMSREQPASVKDLIASSMTKATHLYHDLRSLSFGNEADSLLPINEDHLKRSLQLSAIRTTGQSHPRVPERVADDAGSDLEGRNQFRDDRTSLRNEPTPHQASFAVPTKTVLDSGAVAVGEEGGHMEYARLLDSLVKHNHQTTTTIVLLRNPNDSGDMEPMMSVHLKYLKEGDMPSMDTVSLVHQWAGFISGIKTINLDRASYLTHNAMDSKVGDAVDSSSNLWQSPINRVQLQGGHPSNGPDPDRMQGNKNLGISLENDYGDDVTDESSMETPSPSSDAAYIQIVIQYLYDREEDGMVDGPPPTSPTVRVKRSYRATRVITERLCITHSLENFVQSIDAEVWGLVFARQMVSQYHASVRKAFNGARRDPLDDNGEYLNGSIRRGVLERIDRMAQSVGNQWSMSTSSSLDPHDSKMVTILRMLHHLREGPLLDGPSMQPHSSYLLRSQFLRGTFEQSLRILIPSVSLYPCFSPAMGFSSFVSALSKTSMKVVSYVKTEGGQVPSESSQDEKLLLAHFTEQVLSVPPDAMALLKKYIAVIDYGDIVIIRNNWKSGDGGNDSIDKEDRDKHQKEEPSSLSNDTSVYLLEESKGKIQSVDLKSKPEPSDTSESDVEYFESSNPLRSKMAKQPSQSKPLNPNSLSDKSGSKDREWTGKEDVGSNHQSQKEGNFDFENIYDEVGSSQGGLMDSSHLDRMVGTKLQRNSTVKNYTENKLRPQIHVDSYEMKSTIEWQASYTEYLEQWLLHSVQSEVTVNRYLVPNVVLIPYNGRHHDRLTFGRLSPNHMDGIENLLLDNKSDPMHGQRSNLYSYLNKVQRREDIFEMISDAPVTDQMFLRQYISLLLPNQIVRKLIFNDFEVSPMLLSKSPGKSHSDEEVDEGNAHTTTSYRSGVLDWLAQYNPFQISQDNDQDAGNESSTHVDEDDESQDLV